METCLRKEQQKNNSCGVNKKFIFSMGLPGTIVSKDFQLFWSLPSEIT